MARRPTTTASLLRPTQHHAWLSAAACRRHSSSSGGYWRVASSSASFPRSRRTVAADTARTSDWYCRFHVCSGLARSLSHSIYTSALISVLCWYSSDTSASAKDVTAAAGHPLMDAIADSTNRLAAAITGAGVTAFAILEIGSSAAVAAADTYC